MIAEILAKIKVCEEVKASLEGKIAKEQDKNNKDRNEYSIWYWRGNIVSLTKEIDDLKQLLKVVQDISLIDDKLY